MKNIHYRDEIPVAIDNDVARGITGRVVIGKADGAEKFCMRVFTVAPGGHTPRHHHDWEHEIFVHAGEGQVHREGEWSHVEVGHVVFVPGGEEHQFRNTGDRDLVFVCLVPSGAPEM